MVIKMGLCCSRPPQQVLPSRELTKEERIVMERERLLPFSKATAKKVDGVIRKYTKKGKLSRQEFLRAQAELELDLLKHLEDPESDIYKFFSSMKEGQLFNGRSLALCGILVGGGSEREKAEVLFEHFDKDAGGSLDRKEIHHMLTEIIQMSVDYLTLLAVSENQQANTLDEEQLEAFQNKLNETQESLVNRLADKLLEHKEDIYSVEFVRKVSTDPELKQLLWSTGVRSLLIEEKKRADLPLA